MITFNFIGQPFPSEEEQERAKQFFINKLGDLREEFENNNGVVTYDYSIPPTSHDHCRYSYDLDNFSFIARWMEQEKQRE